MSRAAWFEVDKDGLAQLLQRKGLEFVVFELVQNAWDTGAKHVEVEFEPVEGRPLVKLMVRDDDPDGFKNLSHAYTLFAASDKKADPEKRGRFNLGEKLVIAACEKVHIRTTTGTVIFQGDKREVRSRDKSESGSSFLGYVRMTRAQWADVCKAVHTLLPPAGITTLFNGKVLPARKPLKTFFATLSTEVADHEGYLRPTKRLTEVRVYARQEGESSRLYEMGIPVVDLDDPWDIEIMQKIPLNSNRDNVTPAYLRDVRVAVLNEMHTLLRKEDAAHPTVQEALSDERIFNEVVETVLTHQYGEKRVAFAPNDAEANHNAMAHGYHVIAGGSFSKAQWDNIRRADAAPPATRMFATPKPYSDDPDAPDAKVIPESDWTPGMRNIALYAAELHGKLLGTSAEVRFESRFGAHDSANYCRGQLCFNIARLGKAWFNSGVTESVNNLVLHEFGHYYASSHLDAKFHEGLTKLGAKMVKLALTDPEFFTKTRR